MLQMCPTDALIDSLTGDLMTMSKEFGRALGMCSGTLHVAFSICSNSVSVSACMRLLFITAVDHLELLLRILRKIMTLQSKQDIDLIRSIADGRPSAIENSAFKNTRFLYPSMWARMRDFMAAPTTIKAYIRNHCSNENIDTMQSFWNGIWEDSWSLNASPGVIRACVNQSYVEEYNRCTSQWACPAPKQTAALASWIPREPKTLSLNATSSWHEQVRDDVCTNVCVYCHGVSKCAPCMFSRVLVPRVLMMLCACSRQSATYLGDDGQPIFAPQEIVDRCVKGAFGQLSADSCYAEATVGAPTAVECANLFALPRFAKVSEVLKVVHASQQLRAQCEALTSKVRDIHNPLGHSYTR